MHTISPRRRNSTSWTLTSARLSASSCGDFTTQIKEETDTLDHPGFVDPRRVPTSSARGRTSLACWLKTDTHVQNHIVKFEIAREKHVRAATWMRELWGTPARKKDRDEGAAPSRYGRHRLLAPQA